MSHMMLVNRLVGFGADGKAIGAGFSSVVDQAPSKIVLSLPTDSLDWIGPYSVEGKTEGQIRADVCGYGVDMTYIIIDTLTGQQVGKPYTQRNRARARADRLDNQYGAVRYAVRAVEPVIA